MVEHKRRSTLERPITDSPTFSSPELATEQDHQSNDAEENKEDKFPARDHAKIALFQRTPQGFIFTGPGKDGPDLVLEGEVEKLAIIPTQSMKHVQTLGNISSTETKREEKKLKTVKSLDYGPTATFAPAVDSYHADLSSSDLNCLNYLHTHVRTHDRDLKQLAEELEIMPITLLKDEELEECDADKLLESNASLLEYLKAIQSVRLRRGIVDPTEREKAIANTLQRQLFQLVNRTSPAELLVSSDPEALPRAMARLPHLETAFRGTLPPQKPFAHFSNGAVFNAHPANAGIAPAYSKPEAQSGKSSYGTAPAQPQQAAPPYQGMTSSPLKTPIRGSGVGTGFGTPAGARGSSYTFQQYTHPQQTPIHPTPGVGMSMGHSAGGSKFVGSYYNTTGNVRSQ
ncbi:uncharacterized protein VTP21DRAFT_6717 [Calcarisporiella thermophila]|uniref:uncharacterized protein n=1 Tax=Calcarisporiella thermophila TaxID=911321 RepID=UPI0037427C0A